MAISKFGPEYSWTPAPVITIEDKVQRWLLDASLVQDLITYARDLERQLDNAEHVIAQLRSELDARGLDE